MASTKWEVSEIASDALYAAANATKIQGRQFDDIIAASVKSYGRRNIHVAGQARYTLRIDQHQQGHPWGNARGEQPEKEGDIDTLCKVDGGSVII